MGDIEFARPETYAFAETIYRLLLDRFIPWNNRAARGHWHFAAIGHYAVEGAVTVDSDDSACPAHVLPLVGLR